MKDMRLLTGLMVASLLVASCGPQSPTDGDQGGAGHGGSGPQPPDGCGNGKVEPGEFCDPAAKSEFSCSDISTQYVGGNATCAQNCTLNLSQCVLATTCGNGTVDTGEQCDDGGNIDSDGCSAICLLENPPQDSSGCGSDKKGILAGAEALPDLTCDDPNSLAGYAPGPLLPIRLRFHVARNAANVSAASPAQITTMVADANTILSTAGIVLQQSGTIDYIQSDIFFNLDIGANFANYTALVGTNADASAVDIYLVNTFKSAWSALCGMATDIGPVANNDAAVVATNCGGATLAHELGHNFGLWHTHHQDIGNQCATSGDLCCDTPADPGPSWAAPEGLGMCSNAVQPNCLAACPGGQTPDTDNVMSYYSCGRVVAIANLSSCQSARAACYIDRHYQYAMVPACKDADGDGYGTNDTPACPNSGLDCAPSDPQIHPGAIETCNAKDDDCDGEIDEALVKQCGSDIGECATGSSTCSSGQWGACIGEILPKAEICDGKDNDCDGLVDEDLDPLLEGSKKCPTVGVCINGGVEEVCAGGQWTCQFKSPSYVANECTIVNQACGSGSLLDPTCKDGIDNDCDGVEDENSPYPLCVQHPDYPKVQAGVNCFASPLGKCGMQGGTYECVQLAMGCGVSVDCVGATFPEVEKCDGQDWDCDGKIYDRNDVDGDGYGDCPGWLDCNETTIAISPGVPEVCNGSDDNCNGATDEGNLCDDGNVCTTDNCAGANGCGHIALSGPSCGQNKWCHKGSCGGRFVDLGDGTVKDYLTGYQWQKFTEWPAGNTYSDALSYCNNLVLGGFNDWTLPNYNAAGQPNVESIWILVGNNVTCGASHLDPVFSGYNQVWSKSNLLNCPNGNGHAAIDYNCWSDAAGWRIICAEQFANLQVRCVRTP